MACDNGSVILVLRVHRRGCVDSVGDRTDVVFRQSAAVPNGARVVDAMVHDVRGNVQLWYDSRDMETDYYER